MRYCATVCWCVLSHDLRLA